MIRERQLNSAAFSEGGTQLIDLPRDAAYHLLQLACFAASIASVYGTSATAPTFASTFPFNILRSIRLLRNGSDVVWQGSGEQLAKEHYYLNNRHPKARLYTFASNVETLVTAATRGITLPAVSAVIGANLCEFKPAVTDSTTQTTYFDFQVEMWMQMGLTGDDALMTLVDARKLATFQLEIIWNTQSNMFIPGTNNTANNVSANVSVLSIDQDSIPVDTNFGTFKRSAQTYASLAYGSSGQQILLPRGNYFHGVVISTKAYKSGSTVIPRAENDVVQNIQNRINNNFQLRNTDFRQLQAKNMSNNGGRDNIYEFSEGGPQGWAFMEYTSAAETAGEMVNTYSYDQFDLLLSINPATASSTPGAVPSNGATTGSTNPILDLLIQEVIPGVQGGASAPRASMNGSVGRSSAKMGVRG